MTQPNFVLIITDTQATNVIGCYGHPGMRTPNIDQLARSGVKFERAYTTCPLCTPARAGLFTGVYSHTSGPWTNNLALGANMYTMGQRLMDNGYHTAYSGKWHLDGHDYFGTGICPPGWDAAYWYDGRTYLQDLTDDEIKLWRSGLNSYEDLRRNTIQAEFTWAHRVSDRGIRFLTDRSADKPFLLVLSYDEPHHPFTCPPEYVEPFLDFEYPLGPAGLDSLSDKPTHQREWAENTRITAHQNGVKHPLYFGCNSFVDAEIGRVIDAVHQQAPEDTYIIFTSDHGELLGAHHLEGKGPVMYEEITHIPLIIEQPGGLGAGSIVQSVASHIDVLPAMLELAGLPIPPILEGNSLVPLLQGSEQPDRAAVIEFNRYEIEHDSWGGFQPVRSLVTQRYKLVINLLFSDEFYDLENDPGEVNNRIEAPEYYLIRNELHDRLLDWMYTQRDPFRGPAWERRIWRYSRRYRWKGHFRPRPADGYSPEVRAYDTGQPAEGVKVEYEDKKPE